MDDISTDSLRLVRFGVYDLDLRAGELRKSGVRFLLASSLVLGVAALAQAQRTTATLRGTVVDSSKAVIPYVTVTARNEETGLTRITPTNDSGTYALPDLPIGRYRVNAELQGFKTASRTGIVLRVADDYVVDFTLEAGNFTEVVTVEASPTPVRVVGGDVSGIISGQQARDLPLNGRNFVQLAALVPGVSADDSLNAKDKGLLGGAFLSVSGGATTANLWTVDGANNLDVGRNASFLVHPSPEAIEEFKILRNSYGPEFGNAGGAQINVVTRGGTNTFRGSGFYFVRNDAFNSTDYFLEKNDLPQGELQRNEFGAFVGGPIVKDKLFFFGGLEWNLEDRGTARVAQVPTLAERNGDFSAGPVCSTAPGIPIDPTTGRPFDGNRIPSDRISPGGHAFLSLFPLPNVGAAARSCNNWVTSVTTAINYGQQHIRGDWSVGESARVMVRYTHDRWKNDAPSFQSNLWGDDPFPSVDSNWDYGGTLFVMSLNQTLGTNATNGLQFSYSANRITVRRGGDPELNARVVAAIPNIFPVQSKQHGADIAHPLWWGGGGYGALWNQAPFDNNQDLFVLKDDYTKVFGKHNVKAGALVSFNKKNEDTIGNGSSENQVLWGSTGLNGWGGTTGNILADFLLKDMAFGFSESSAGRQAPQRWRDAEFYFADSWEVSPNLTFDYGIRYSMYFNPYTADDKITSFVPALFNPALGADACNGNLQPPGRTWCEEANARGGMEGPNRSLMYQDFNNIAPRLGVAWDLRGDGKTAVRAGIGQFFQREQMSPVLGIARNTPFVQKVSGTRTLDTNVEPCAGCFTEALGTPTLGRELEYRVPNTWQWNVMVQTEIWRNTTIEAGYVGSRGHDLLRNHDANQVLTGDADANGVDDRLQYANSTPANGALRPFGVFGDSQILIWDTSGESTYHSLQTQFVSRFGRGSQFQASYTVARSRANFNLSDVGAALSQGFTSLDNENPDHDWGRPDVGRTNIFNMFLVHLLPTLDDTPRVIGGLFGGWELAAIVNAATGQPFTAYTGPIPGLNGGPSGTGYTDNQRPNRTSEPCRAGGDPAEQIINPAAYTLDGFQLGSIGTAKRGDCTGPGYFQMDLAFYRNFRIADTVKLQFRWDVFNVFNNTNFRGVNAVLQPSSAVLNNPAPNATIIESAVIPASFGQATSTRDARQMQFGLKIIW